MRRAVATATLIAALTATAGCAAAPTGDPSAPGAAVAKAASAVAAARPSAAAQPSADHTADTAKVCGQVNQVFEKDMEKFGQELGKLIVYKEAKNSAQVKKAEASARRQLEAMATTIRTHTGAAQDPQLRRAGQESADAMQATAKSNFFTKVDSIDGLEKVVGAEFLAWLLPLGDFCE